MNIKRAGHTKPTKFGACKTAKDVLRYARAEGFPTARARCSACAHRWTMIVGPDAKRPSLGHAEGQTCPECGKEAVFVVEYTKN